MRYILSSVIILLNIISGVLFAIGFISLTHNSTEIKSEVKYLLFYPGMFFIVEATLGLALLILKCRFGCSCNCINMKPNPEETELLSRQQNSINAVYNSI